MQDEPRKREVKGTSSCTADEPGIFVTQPSIERDLPYETKCFVCIHVFDRSRPVLYVTRPDGDWCALCGAEHPEDANAYRVVGIGHVIDDDPGLSEILDLAPNQEAERSTVGDPWVRSSF